MGILVAYILRESARALCRREGREGWGAQPQGPLGGGRCTEDSAFTGTKRASLGGSPAHTPPATLKGTGKSLSRFKFS